MRFHVKCKKGIKYSARTDVVGFPVDANIILVFMMTINKGGLKKIIYNDYVIIIQLYFKKMHPVANTDNHIDLKGVFHLICAH